MLSRYSHYGHRPWLFGLFIFFVITLLGAIVQQRRDDNTFEAGVLSSYAEYVASFLADEMSEKSIMFDLETGLRKKLGNPAFDMASWDLSHGSDIKKDERLRDVPLHPGVKSAHVVLDASGIAHYIASHPVEGKPEGHILVMITPKSSLLETSRLFVPLLLPFAVLFIFWPAMAILLQQRVIIASSQKIANRGQELKRITEVSEDFLHGFILNSYNMISKKISDLNVKDTSPREKLETIQQYIYEKSISVRYYIRYFRSLTEDNPIVPILAEYLRAHSLNVKHPKISWNLPPEKQIEQLLSGNMDAKLALRMNLYDAAGNAISHSEADSVKVCLKVDDGAVILTVQDNGKGFDLDATLRNLKPREGREHLGLEHFLRRARQFNEKIEEHQVIRTSPGNGCTICLRIPRQQIKKLNFRNRLLEYKSLVYMLFEALRCSKVSKFFRTKSI